MMITRLKVKVGFCKIQTHGSRIGTIFYILRLQYGLIILDSI